MFSLVNGEIPNKSGSVKSAQKELFYFICHMCYVYLWNMHLLKVKFDVCVVLRCNNIFAFCVPTICVLHTAKTPEYCVPKGGVTFKYPCSMASWQNCAHKNNNKSRQNKNNIGQENNKDTFFYVFVEMLSLKIIDNNSTSCFCFTLFVEAMVITDSKYLCNNTQTNPTIC